MLVAVAQRPLPASPAATPSKYAMTLLSMSAWVASKSMAK
jgi:hypothetical protein